jgi:benzoate-CoA ligase
MNLFEAIFREQALSSTALLFEERQITYAELRDQTVRFAGLLKTLHVNPGDRVGLLLNDSPEFLAAFISICSSGAIAVPINMGLGLDEQRAILKDCTARFALVEADLCSSLLTDAREPLHLEELVAVLRDGNETLPSSSQKVRSLQSLLRQSSDETNFPPADPAGAAFILYTSGSTGEPKGAVHSQSDIFYTNQTFCREVLRLRAGDRLFSSSRLPFAYGLGNSLSFPLLNSVTSVLCREKPTPAIISKVFARYRPTIFFGVPVVYNLLLDHHRRVGQLDCSSLRLCISAGEALPAQLGEDWEKTFGIAVLDGIGSTEMLHMFISNHEGAVRYGSSGKLLEGYSARLLDELGNETPFDQEGNLWISGNSAAKGYWQRLRESERTFVDGWVRTGDLYRRDAGGYWYHMGRSDDCFKSSGQWVSPVEVEGVLLRHQGVSRAAVVEDFDEAGLPCACAFIVGKDQKSDPVTFEAALREFVREKLPRFKRPRQYVFTEELPYTATGKVQRFKLRRQLRNAASSTQ